ncbi:MAG: AbrB/MazE/SpoVT family DNA-binding domain-containing protein [Lachnospiraceae bacterium]|nr:AbrB/MazE/SpoVT family DNA-binding domain-containing protein [Lachnospiraceae bacterium]
MTNENGVIRHIDHLGRIVIPKDFRRASRIQDGDPVEVYTNSQNEIIIRKFDPHEELSNHIKFLTEQLEIYKYDLDKNKKILELFHEIIDVLEK